MPNYDYLCSNCDTRIEDVFQNIRDAAIIVCPECGHDSLERLICAPSIFVRGEATTIGQLSERNSKKLGKYEVQERTLKDKDSKKDAIKEAKRELNSKINKMSNSEKIRYIENG